MSSELVATLAPAGTMPFLRPLAVVRRRSKIIGVVLAAALVAVTLISLLWPATYLSTGTILIEQQEVPTDFVRSTISSFASQRLQVISQRVMTTTRLMQIIEKYDLYAKERRKKARETIVQRMRDDIHFRTISADVIDPRQGRPVQATIAFSLGYQSRSPEVAARVANELFTLYLNENLVTRKQLAEEATAFLSAEADKLSKQMNELESKLAAFKERHLDDLPEATQLNMQLVNRGDDELRDIDQEMRTIDQQAVYLDAQLAQVNPSASVFTSTGERVMSPSDRLKILRSEYDRAAAIYAPDHPDVVRLKRQIDGLEADASASPADANDRDRELRQAEAALAQARQRYSGDHPDVVRLQRQVDNLKAASAAAPAAHPQVQPGDADNPVYIQLRTQREVLTTEKKGLQDKRVATEARIHELEGRLEASPGVEQEYTKLRRDLDNVQLQYRDKREKQMEAEVAQSLESESKGERFSPIEPPQVPEEPTSPNRPLIITLGAFMALVVAGATAVALELLDGSVRGATHLSSLLTAPPLAVIPRFESQVAARRRVRRWLILAGSGAAALVLALVLVDVFYRPLDVLWAVIMRKLGG
ncbi:MAG TPA: hypothetical protein VMI92_11225 [Steroidobacteraceae bacterium]|nr:hypothetical protein [Steroidobacteraceae bacterium]